MHYRENYWLWMIQNLQLSRHDRKFMTDVYNRRIDSQRTISPKQAELWETLVYRYRRQIQEQNIDPDAILASEWQVTPREPLPDHTTNQLLLRDNYLIMRSPYNKDAVDCWREHRQTQGLTDESWNPDTKEWVIPLTVNNLRATLDYCKDARPSYDISHDIQDLLDPSILDTTRDHWLVTAHLVNDRIIISCANEYLMAALPEDLPVNLTTLNRLTMVGVEISPELRHQCCASPEDAELAVLNSEKSTSLCWGDRSRNSILRYLAQHSDLHITLETFEDQDAYSELVTEIQQRWPQRVQTYHRSDRGEYDLSQLFKSSNTVDYNQINFDRVDVFINRELSLFDWNTDLVLPHTAKKIIYYIDPAYDREDYLDRNRP